MKYILGTVRWLGSLCGPSLPLLLLLLVFIPMAGCSKMGALSLLTGGGPNVAANTQVGKTNNQTVGTNVTHAPTVTLRPKARVDTIDQSVDTTVNQELPMWVWILGSLLFIIGWVTDTPATYISNLRRNKRK